MKTGTTVNSRTPGAELYEIDFTPRGTAEKITIHVWAKDRMAAHNEMILRKIWGKQHEIRLHSSNLIASK